MNILIIGISLIMVIASVVFAPKKVPSTTQEPITTPEESSTPAPTTSAPSSVPNFQYPGERTDDVDKITDWYKDKIKSGGYNVKSFVTTKTNGKVLNKLIGANEDGKIEIVITQASEGSPVEISVNFE